MAKPFSIQSPEDIAKEYAGNKQRIAEAMQMGIVDPTAGVLAGMFIDRMRNAATSEAGTPPTVAQQVMGGVPPVPSPSLSGGGLGATAQAAPPMAPTQAPMQTPMPMPEEAPMGMADGGMVPPYAMGGLDGIPVPDTMFDENRNGGFNDGYAGGGLVAFADGGPTTFYGYSATDPMANAAKYESLFGKPQTKYSDEYEQELLQERSPQARKRAKKEDLAYALMAMGSRIAATPGNFLQGLSAGFGEAAPILRQSAKERKAEDRDLRKGLLDLEAGRNTAAAQKATQLLQMQQLGIQGAEAAAGREAQIALEKLKQTGDINLERLRQSGRLGLVAARGGGGGGGGSGASSSDGSGITVTANKYGEIKEKFFSATEKFNAAKQAWLAAGKPREDDKSSRRAAIARAYIDAANMRKDIADMVASVRVKGYNYPAASTPKVKSSNTLPQGVTQREWDAMTPQERALFQ